MKIDKINSINYMCKTNTWSKKHQNKKNDLAENIILNNIPYYEPINFSGTLSCTSSKLRSLFAYNLPCIYTNVPTIDPKVFSKWIRNKSFSRPSEDIIKILLPYKDSFTGIEKRVIEIIYEQAIQNPKKDLYDILQSIKHIHRRRLLKKQNPIFQDIIELSHKLPIKYKYKFKQLMLNTYKKLNEEPVIVPFSSYEFIYKLQKIKEVVHTGQDTKSQKVINKLLKESKKFAKTTNSNTIDTQKKVINFLDIILKKSVLKKNQQLNSLISESKSRLNQEPTMVKFSKKTFIYDLEAIIADLSDKSIYNEMLLTAQKLPTSRESVSAFIMKLSSEPSEKIGHALVWPSVASIEHLLPRSCGGSDSLSNVACATTKSNSERSNIDFIEQLKRHPNIPMYCQHYVDKNIKLYHKGIYSKFGISPKYITDFAKTIYELSRHRIKLNTSELYKTNK